MEQVYVHYNPYHLETIIKIDGEEISPDSSLYQSVQKKKLRDWANTFPELLEQEYGSDKYEIRFYGLELDWEDFKEAFYCAEKEEILAKTKLTFIEEKPSNDIGQKILDYFASVQYQVLSGCKDTELITAIKNKRSPISTIYVAGAAGAGKSTLVNALLRKRIMPCQNIGSTNAVVKVMDKKVSGFTAKAYNEKNEVIEETEAVTYDKMQEFHNNAEIYHITMEGNIPFLRMQTDIPVLVDTPNTDRLYNRKNQIGLIDQLTSLVNRAKECEIIKQIMDEIRNHEDSLVLYVLDGAHLYEKTEILDCIIEQIKKGGKQAQNRFLFVLNKMDTSAPEAEDMEKAVESVKEILVSYGIENPYIFPCSAFTALHIRTSLKNIDINKLTRENEKQLSASARDALAMIDKITAYESMYLEQYAPLSLAAQGEIESHLLQSEQRGDTKMQALIHSGIPSIERYIASYMKKYIEIKKTKDLIEAFHAYHQNFIETDSYKILVTATMSAGKSTFINALTGKNICLSRNMACTSKLHSIVSKPFDTDFTFEYDYALSIVANREKDPDIADKTVVRTVYYEGILAGQRLIINDSPGVNFSGDAEHKQITDQMISAGNYQLMVYLMNATQLGTEDENAHLEFVKEHIGDKAILFVINKIDALNEDEEDIEEIAQTQIKRLEAMGFKKPLVCPVSARAGFLAKKAEKEELTRIERRERNNMEDKFEQMNIVDYYTKYFPDITVPDSEDEDRQLLKTCGISYIETIIKAFCEGGDNYQAISDTNY